MKKAEIEFKNSSYFVSTAWASYLTPRLGNCSYCLTEEEYCSVDMASYIEHQFDKEGLVTPTSH